MLFRDVNERINALADGWQSDQPQELVCECSDETCTVTISISRAEYEAVRSHPDRFLVAPSHHDESTEQSIATGEHYSVVEKLPRELGLVA